jgi:hypothetical protein
MGSLRILVRRRALTLYQITSHQNILHQIILSANYITPHCGPQHYTCTCVSCNVIYYIILWLITRLIIAYQTQMSPLISIVLLTTFSCRPFSFAQFACFAGTKVLALPVQKCLRLLVQKYLLTCRPFSLVLISVAHLSNTQLLRCQYLYFCTSKAKSYTQLRCQYLYFCTSKGVSICTFVLAKTTSSCRPFSLVLISVAHLS